MRINILFRSSLAILKLNLSQKKLRNNKIKQNMDNGMMRTLFDILKIEMFYKRKDNYKILGDLIKITNNYIYYYNYDGIKVKLKGLPPLNYRLQSFN